MKEESESVGLKLNIQKMKIMASGPITSWQINGETVEPVTDFIFAYLWLFSQQNDFLECEIVNSGRKQRKKFPLNNIIWPLLILKQSSYELFF